MRQISTNLFKKPCCTPKCKINVQKLVLSDEDKQIYSSYSLPYLTPAFNKRINQYFQQPQRISILSLCEEISLLANTFLMKIFGMTGKGGMPKGHTGFTVIYR